MRPVAWFLLVAIPLFATAAQPHRRLPRSVELPAAAIDGMEEVREAILRQDWRDAVQKLRPLQRPGDRGETSVQLQFWLGYTLARLGSMEEAVRLLEPFETVLKDSESAAEALYELGLLRQERGDFPGAITAWKLALARQPSSETKDSLLLNSLHLLFYDVGDFDACLPICERATAEYSDPDLRADAGYLGAFCLVKLGRNKEADRWIERWFSPTDPLHEAWRRLVLAAHHFSQSEAEQGFDLVAKLDRDFPELDSTSRLDLRLRTSHLLRTFQRADKAHTLLLRSFRDLADRSEDEILSVLDELAAVLGTDRLEAIVDDLRKLLADPTTPLTVQVILRDRLSDIFRNEERLDEAKAELEGGLRSEAEFARARAALALARLMDEEEDNPLAAGQVLERILKGLTRRDLQRSLQRELEHYRTPRDP